MKSTLQQHPNLAQCPLINQSFRIAPCTKLTSVSNFSVLLICFLCCFVLWIIVWSEFPVYKYCIKKSVKSPSDLVNIIFLFGSGKLQAKKLFQQNKSLRNNKIVKEVLSLQSKLNQIWLGMCSVHMSSPLFFIGFLFSMLFFWGFFFLTIGCLVVHCIVSLSINRIMASDFPVGTCICKLLSPYCPFHTTMQNNSTQYKLWGIHISDQFISNLLNTSIGGHVQIDSCKVRFHMIKSDSWGKDPPPQLSANR